MVARLCSRSRTGLGVGVGEGRVGVANDARLGWESEKGRMED